MDKEKSALILPAVLTAKYIAGIEGSCQHTELFLEIVTKISADISIICRCQGEVFRGGGGGTSQTLFPPCHNCNLDCLY